MKQSFSISISIDHDLTIEEVWPDGDAPENPTADDVKKALYGKDNPSSYEVKRALDDWDLLDVDASCVSILAVTPPCDKCGQQFGRHRRGCENAPPNPTAAELNQAFAHVPLENRPVFCEKCGGNSVDGDGECIECGHVQSPPPKSPPKDVPYDAGLVEEFEEAVDPYEAGSKESERWQVGLKDGRHEAQCRRGSE